MIILDRDNNKWFVTLTRYDCGSTIHIINHTGAMYRTGYITANKASNIEKDIIGLNNQICWAELAFIFVKHNVDFTETIFWNKSNL